MAENSREDVGFLAENRRWMRGLWLRIPRDVGFVAENSIEDVGFVAENRRGDVGFVAENRRGSFLVCKIIANENIFLGPTLAENFQKQSPDFCKRPKTFYNLSVAK